LSRAAPAAESRRGLFKLGHDAAVSRLDAALFRGREVLRDGEVGELLDGTSDVLEAPLEQVDTGRDRRDT